MEYATVVSLVPLNINEQKPGIYPSTFKISKSDGRIPQTLEVGSSFYYLYVGEGRGEYGNPKYRDYIRQNISCDQMARSIVNDYISSQLQMLMGEAEPALFWVPERATPEEVLAQYEDRITEHIRRQNNWFSRLVKLADDDWERYRQHKIITDTQRLAAKMLGLERPWVINPVAEASQKGQTMRCTVCRTEIMSDAIVCPNCKVILDSEKYKKFQFAGALVNV